MGVSVFSVLWTFLAWTLKSDGLFWLRPHASGNGYTHSNTSGTMLKAICNVGGQLFNERTLSQGVVGESRAEREQNHSSKPTEWRIRNNTRRPSLGDILVSIGESRTSRQGNASTGRLYYEYKPWVEVSRIVNCHEFLFESHTKYPIQTVSNSVGCRGE